MSGALHRARNAHRSHRDLIILLAVGTLIVDIAGSGLVYWLEPASLGDSVFWTTTQLLTISSQMSLPQTAGGKVVDVFLELWGLVVVTTLAGSWGAFFLERRRSQSRSA
jgi:hypothetical protein